MSIIAKDNRDPDWENIPTGTQQAVCAFVRDIGTQEGTYMGRQIRKRQCVILWELSKKRTRGENAGMPFMISKFYTLSLNEKANLCKDLESWRGKGFTAKEKEGFDISVLESVNCLLNIIDSTKTDGKKTIKVASISPLLPEMQPLLKTNLKPPAWVEEIITRSVEWAETHGIDQEISDDETIDDDLPF